MVPLDSTRVVKGILFAGCSFTWGQGLYYYSNLPTLQEPAPDCYDPALVTGGHKRFMEANRFPRIVAKHFDTWEVVHPFNGGSNLSAIRWWHSSFNDDFHGPDRTVKEYEYNEFSHVFFQLTQWHRDNVEVDIDGEQYSVPMNVLLGGPGNEEWPSRFARWLKMRNLTWEQWIQIYIDENVARVKKFLQDFEKHGVKATIILWPEKYNHEAQGDEYISRIQADPWLAERLMKIDYKGNTYNSMEALMQAHPEMTIKYDADSFKVAPQDHHPSLTCHRVMADNIIKRLTAQGYR
jgi:hypothetical protein